MQLLDIKEASKLVRLQPSTIYKMVCARKIPFTKLGGKLLFSVEKIERWVEQNTTNSINQKRDRDE